jgi:hypothetical protein
MGYSATFVLSQLGYQAPVLLVCLAGIIMAAVYLPRARTPALLTLAGSSLWLVASLASTALNAYLLRMRIENSGSASSLAPWYTVVGVAGSVSHAVALGLIVAAVFAGRPARAPI